MNELTVMYNPINQLHVVYLDGLMVHGALSLQSCVDWMDEHFAPPIKVEWCFKEKE